MTVKAGYASKHKSPEAYALIVEKLRDQVRVASSRYVKLRIAVLDFLNATPMDEDAALQRLRREVGRWETEHE